MIDTFLFDLDGTLLPLDTEKFIDIYFLELGKYFADMTNPKLLVKNVLTATDAMISNTEHKTNEQVFIEAFSRLIDGDIDVYMKRFESFYETHFHKVRQAAYDQPIIKKCIETLKHKKYTAAIATNPLFPQAAIHQRIEWSGLDVNDFSHITTYECSHYCKPNVEYYQEILSVLGKKPEQCIMVGNDVQEDLVAAKLGMQTFLITDNIINRNDEQFHSTYEGNYEDFHKFVENLKSL